MITRINIRKLLLIVLGCLIAVTVQSEWIFFSKPLLPGKYAHHGLSSVAYAEESQTESHLAGSESVSGEIGHEAHGEAEGEKFFGYAAFFAVISCIYFAVILKIWPVVLGKHEEEHH